MQSEPKNETEVECQIVKAPGSSSSSSGAHLEDHESEDLVIAPIASVAGAKPQLLRIKSYASGAEGYADTRVEGLLTREKTGGTVGSSLVWQKDPDFEVDWEDDDPENPRNWSLGRKAFLVFTMSFGTTTIVLFSTSYASALKGITLAFGITDTVGVLGITTYMTGIAAGSLVLAPLSEMYGRRPVYLIALSCFILLTLPSALAQNIQTILITRFFGAFAGSALISNGPGSVNDCVIEKYRALAFSIWSIGPMGGPLWGPLIGGFVFQYLGWRWTNWVVVILAGVALVFIACVPETYAPTLLKKRAANLRKQTNDDRWWTRYDETRSFLPLLSMNLSRPFSLMFTEPICIFWDIYVAIVYGILYLCFVAYPIVFGELRGWSPGLSGLAFVGIGIGILLVIVCEPLIRRIIDSHPRDKETGEIPAEAMVSVVAFGSVCLAIGQLWFAWTCTPNVHWVIPLVAGIPFGIGNGTVFIYASNYLVHSYGMYAASALAGNALLRSLLGATMPLAGPQMYAKLGPNWAGTVAGVLELVCIPIPVVFYLYGHKIRAKSPLIKKLREEERRQAARRRSRNVSVQSKVSEVYDDIEKRAEAEAMAGVAMATGAAIDENITKVDVLEQLTT